MTGRHGTKLGGIPLITRSEIGGILRNLDHRSAKTASLLRLIALEGLVICVLLALIVGG